MSRRPSPVSSLGQPGRVAVAGGWLAVHRTGGGLAPLVLCHGLTDNGMCWRRVVRELAGDFDVVMIDARGHGESSRCVPDRSAAPGEDLAQVVDALDLAAPVVMGHSVGARAAADFAASYPGRISGLILEDPAFLPLPGPSDLARSRERFRTHVQRFQTMSEAQILEEGRATSPGWHDEDFPDWARAKLQVDPEALPVHARPWQEVVSAIRAPTWIVHGEAARGSLVTVSVRADIKTLKPDVEMREIAGAGHNTRRENFPVFMQAVRAALSAAP